MQNIDFERRISFEIMMRPNQSIGGTLKQLRNLLSLSILIVTIYYGSSNYHHHYVHSWMVGDSGSPDYNYAVQSSSTSNLMHPFYWPVQHQHHKRQSLPNDDRLTSNNSENLGTQQSGGQPVQSGWFDIFGTIFPPQNQNQEQKPKPLSPVIDSLDNHVRNILVPRVSGTTGNIVVRNYIINQLKDLGYYTFLDEFVDPTPVGRVKFANIIATSNPDACRQLAIACHYDSKMMEGFLGAIDSAVPCAMMLEMAQTFETSFKSTPYDQQSNNDSSLGLMFIFFDGEEAFHQWTDTDSLYGSRHLAAKWEKQPAPKHCDLKNELGRLELLVVLDLIGTSDTTFSMYSRKLKSHYKKLQEHEKSYIRDKKRLQGFQARQATTFKSNYIPLEFMQDDHVPFYKRDVPVLSLLASPFPSVWHTVKDNYDAIDFPKTRQILHSIESFIANYNKTGLIGH